MRTIVIVLLSFGSLVAAGCIEEHRYVDPNAQATSMMGGDPFAGGTALQFSGSGSLSGDIGPVTGFQGTRGVRIEGYDDGVCTYVTITGVGDNGTGSMVIDLMPRADDLPEGTHGVGVSDETAEGSLVTTQADTDDGGAFYGDAEDGAVIMTHLPDGSRQLEVHALVDDRAGRLTEAVGEFRLQPTR
ncbi:MAG: hypothetical protein A2138_15250 [Deltaproteobacteria bacterium RBG_16_71_12]|nr:MAG: hypothetical protein A2138_15250 [Deltaproteobacteria bacterium RBG_16_71_12]